MTEEFGGPTGACRSKVGVEAIEEPCTNRMVPRSGPAVRRFSHKKIFWPLTLVQCSRPLALGTVIASLMSLSLVVLAREHAELAFIERDRDALAGGKFLARVALHPQHAAGSDLDHKLDQISEEGLIGDAAGEWRIGGSRDEAD